MRLANIKEKLKAFKIYKYWFTRLKGDINKTAFLIGTPTHVNVGDSAIVMAEIAFLKQNGYENILEITLEEYSAYRKCILRLMPKYARIFLPGGGNMGSLWPIEEKWRSQIIQDFAQHQVVVFPQTIYYANDFEATALKENSVAVYNTKSNLTVVAREQKSFDLMKQLYPNLNVVLAPDIVLSMGYQPFIMERDGILVCFRHDKERSLSINDEEKMMVELKEQGYIIKVIDTMAEKQITIENREEIVREKMQQFAAARLVITDRLHGMIFAAITGTPCIVLENNHHKVRGTYEWIKDLDYIHFMSTIEEALSFVSELYNKVECKFVFNMDNFNELKRLIREKVGFFGE